ncbi:50S ribosomal protein L29 [bacterium]|jgi:ribosomal protein L29|nr:50S ribosomal protein L29 [bacterium]NBX78746.1 50S ribosomal protein L29 [bacterium]
MRKTIRQELSQMSAEQLLVQATEIRKELFNLRMKRMSAPLKDVHISRKLRKSLACALTFLKQKSL